MTFGWRMAAGCLALAIAVSTLAQGKKPLTNQDVVAMVKSGLDESTILMAIQASPNEFDVSVPALIELKNQKVSEALIRAMVAAAAHKPVAAASAASSQRPTAQRKQPAQFTAFPVDFYAEQFAALGANAAPVSEGKVYVGKGRLRFENTGAQSTATIVDPTKPAAYILLSGGHAEVQTVFQGVRGAPARSGLSKFLLPVDPQNPCANWVDVECKAMGPETVEGRSTTKWDLTHTFDAETWHSYIWVDVRLHVVSKRQYKENTIEFRNIVEAPQASGLFDVP